MTRRGETPKLSAGDIRRAFRDLDRLLRRTRDAANASAARFVGRGLYEKAERFVREAKSLGTLRSDLVTALANWTMRRRDDPGSGKERRRTALWEVYVPILRVLAGRPDGAKVEGINQALVSSNFVTWRPGDVLTDSKGRPAWTRLVRRARKPMLREGWIESERGVWKVTAAGRIAAVSASAPPSSMRPGEAQTTGAAKEE